MVSPARLAAFHVLRLVETGPLDLASALDQVRRSLDDVRDRGLTSEIVHGVLRWRAALDHVIAWAGRRPIEEFDAEVLEVLRIGAYQLLHLSRVPASAAVSDSVELVRRVGAIRAAGAVNAILRAISRQQHALPWPTEDDPVAFLSVTCSHPPWLAARWLNRLGFERAWAWTRFNNAPAPMVLRAHSWIETRETLAAWLAKAGIETEATRFAPDGLVVTQGNPMTDTSEAGVRFTVQDESAQLVAAFVGAVAGERIFDACAAPGGKTTALAAAVREGGRVVAADFRPRRVRLLARLLRATGVPGVDLIQADATRPLPLRPVFDAVLVDAPCSGLGTIRRDPDIRWRRQEADLATYADTQDRILQEAARLVRPGGRVVYATCSSEPEENEDVVDRFLGRHPAWRTDTPATLSPRVPAGVVACLDTDGHLRTSPDQHRLDPFFAACLRAPG
jgi:16S rRNA (cytosine967-C5)-methyltransferase